MSKKILFISELVGLGGGETSLLNTAVEMQRKGYSVTVLVPARGEFVNELERHGIHVEIKASLFLTKKSLPLLPFILLKCIRFLLSHSFEIVHSNAMHSSFVFGLCCKAVRVPFFYTCHGQWYTLRYPLVLLLQWLCAQVIAVSKNVENNLLKQGFRSAKVKQIYLGIDTAKFACSRTVTNTVGDRRLVIGMIARFQKVKAQDLFVQCVDRLIRSGQGESLQFVMVGGNTFGNPEDATYTQEVYRYIEEHGLDKYIERLGERKDIPELLSRFDILVVPSRNESFGMVIVEAMAARCAVIASNCDGPTEIIQHNDNGLLFPVGQVEGLAQAIADLTQDRDRRRQIADRAYEYALKNYDIRHMVDEYLNLYNREHG
jgi:glycosyltransferase involved in cell wall biosynthesis